MPFVDTSVSEPHSRGNGVSAIPDWSTVAPVTKANVRAAVARRLRGPRARRTVEAANQYSDTREADLVGGHRKRLRLRCRGGYRPYTQHWGVGWYTRQTPKSRDGSVRESARRIRRGIEITATASKKVRPRTARLQVGLGCRKNGTAAPRLPHQPFPR